MVTWSNTTPENYAGHIVFDIRPQKAVLPGRALCLPTFSHFLIVNKNPLSRARSLSLFLSLSLSRSLVLSLSVCLSVCLTFSAGRILYASFQVSPTS